MSSAMQGPPITRLCFSSSIEGHSGPASFQSRLASGLAQEMGKVATVGLAPAVFGPMMNITGSILASHWHKDALVPGKKEYAMKK